MKTEKVYSPIEDKNISSNIIGSPIWKECYHSTDNIPPNAKFVYTIKFDGLIPVQVTKMETL